MNVALIPGFVGSELSDNLELRPFVSSKVWVDKGRILSGALAYLDLAPDGDSPGPIAKGVSCRPGSPEPSYYNPLVAALQEAGHKVEPLGWDWRKDIQAQGRRLGAAILGLFTEGDIAIVAHSAGGLVARNAVDWIKANGHYNRIKRIIYLGTPQWGSYYVVSALCRQADLYQSLVVATGGHTVAGQQPARIVLDTILAHFVGLYQLLPAWGYGPFWDGDAANVSRLYVADFWAGVNNLVTQERLDRARTFWTNMKDLVYREKESFIAGTDQGTASSYSYDKNTNLLIEAVNHNTGDDTVEKQSAVPADAQLWVGSSAWAHERMPQIGDLQKKVIQFIGA